MLTLFIVVLGAVSACTQKTTVGYGSFSKVSPKFGSMVVGGGNAEIGDFPYQVSLQVKGGISGQGHYCGGSLISLATVLTAGHCITEVNIGLFQHVEISAGLVSLSKPGPSTQSSKVSKTIVNPDFPGHHILEVNNRTVSPCPECSQNPKTINPWLVAKKKGFGLKAQ